MSTTEERAAAVVDRLDPDGVILPFPKIRAEAIRLIAAFGVEERAAGERENERLTRKVVYLQGVERAFLSLLAAIRTLDSSAVIAATALEAEPSICECGEHLTATIHVDTGWERWHKFRPCAVPAPPSRPAEPETPWLVDHAFVDAGNVTYADGQRSDACQHITHSRVGDRVCAFPRADHPEEPSRPAEPKHFHRYGRAGCIVCTPTPRLEEPSRPAEPEKRCEGCGALARVVDSPKSEPGYVYWQCSNRHMWRTGEPSRPAEPEEKEKQMSETRQEVRIVLPYEDSREIHLEAVAEVFGDNTPEEAVRIVREALANPNLRVEYVDPAVEG